MSRDAPAVLSADGLIYCAPWCGGRCKKADFDQATTAAALAKRLGAGWKAEVWENLGWHWRVERGGAQIYGPSPGTRDTRFMVMLNVGGTQFVAHADEAEDALGFAVQDARTLVSKIEEDLRSLSEESPAHD